LLYTGYTAALQYTQQQRLAPEVPDESALYSPIGLVRRTGVLAIGKYYGRHLKKNSNCDISAADHPIPMYSVFGSTTGFSGSADRVALFPASPNSIGMMEKQCARSNYIGQNLMYFFFPFTPLRAKSAIYDWLVQVQISSSLRKAYRQYRMTT